MNNTEETMSNTLPGNTLIAHSKSLELFDEVRTMTWRLLNPILVPPQVGWTGNGVRYET